MGVASPIPPTYALIGQLNRPSSVRVVAIILNLRTQQPLLFESQQIVAGADHEDSYGERVPDILTVDGEVPVAHAPHRFARVARIVRQEANNGVCDDDSVNRREFMAIVLHPFVLTLSAVAVNAPHLAVLTAEIVKAVSAAADERGDGFALFGAGNGEDGDVLLVDEFGVLHGPFEVLLHGVVEGLLRCLIELEALADAQAGVDQEPQEFHACRMAN